MMMPSDDAMTEPVPIRRIEVFTGAGHRRRWSAEDKARIVAESYVGAESVCAVARRYGLDPTQLFTWRREARKRPGLVPMEPMFAPVVVDAPPEAPIQPAESKPSLKSRSRHDGMIELEIDGVTIRVGRDAQSETIAAVIRALKTTR